MLRLSAATLVLGLSIYLTACLKEPSIPVDAVQTTHQVTGSNEPDIIPVNQGETVYRGCSPCIGTLGISHNSSIGSKFYAEIQTRACIDLPWTTEFSVSDFTKYSNPDFLVCHEKYYRIILTNKGTQTRTFSSTIQNPSGLGFISADLGAVPPLGTATAEYNGKGNCGCEWVYDCSGTEE